MAKKYKNYNVNANIEGNLKLQKTEANTDDNYEILVVNKETKEVETAEIAGGGGGGDNFATADLTFTDDRIHDAGSFKLDIKRESLIGDGSIAGTTDFKITQGQETIEGHVAEFSGMYAKLTTPMLPSDVTVDAMVGIVNKGGSTEVLSPIMIDQNTNGTDETSYRKISSDKRD